MAYPGAEAGGHTQEKGVCAVNFLSSDVRERRFSLVRKGYDPVDVDMFLDEIASALDDITTEHESAGSGAAEEAVRLTSAAATTARDQMLDTAKEEIGRIHRTAETAAERLVRNAEDEAQSVMIAAKRDALSLMERSRAEADALVTAARVERSQLEERLVELRNVVQRTENLLKGMASGALGDVGKASAMLSTIDVYQGSRLEVQVGDDVDDFNVDVKDTEGVGSTEADDLPGSVDRLLEQLRDIS